MEAIPNYTKRQLASGKVALGMGLRQARTVDIAAIGKKCGFEWLFIDMEHSSLDVDTAAQIATAALPVGITPIVRVPGKEHHHASRLLDSGAQGIVVPHVDTVEEAQQAVSYCKFPPVGHRSIAGLQPLFGFDTIPPADFARMANDETLVVVMLETPAAIAKAEAIAAVPGVDVVLIGTNDLTAEIGIPGLYADSRVEDAYRSVITACKKHGKHPGMGGVYETKLMEKYIKFGMRFILSGSDTSFLISGGTERAKFLHNVAL
ncbi:MAG: Aldolase [Betaproteobacteria bacterium]|jgi:2-keto-3-deoxy-L-rhamnonate aldolase RhmA|nr:Aldolase [Betaproteobacteria bacterium]